MFTRILKRWRKSVAWLRGWFMNAIVLRWHQLTGKPIDDLNAFERRVAFIERFEYSQNGEDGIINAILGVIGTTNKYFVEFGVEDGMQCNTRYLLKHRGWTGLMMDGQEQKPGSTVKREFITTENINELFKKHGVPEEFDLLSIDIDGNDYWVWKAIDVRYRPRVVIMEYNACIPASPAVTIPYDPNFHWDGTDYYGASLAALEQLGKQKGYTLIVTDKNGVNAFFLRNDVINGKFRIRSLEEIYKPASFKGIAGKAHPKDTKNRQWQIIAI